MTRADVLSLGEWETFNRSHGTPTFFASPAWSRALRECDSRYRIQPLKFALDSGETAILPLIRVSSRRLQWRVLIGMPFGAYTAILSEDGLPAQPSMIDDVLRYLARHLADSVELTLWPLGPQPSRVLEGVGTPHETAVIDLRRGAEAALSSMEGSSRRMAGQAQRKGVICSPERGAAAAETYYEILAQAATKWGLERPTISRELLLAVSEQGENDVEIWLARFEGRAISGGVVLYGRDEAFFWSAATVPDYAVLRANNSLAVSVILAAAARNVTWLNLGASEGLPGVQRFKRYLGATLVPYNTIRLERPIYQLYQTFRSKFRRSS